MGNVLSETKRQQVIALGQLGWSLRRIEQETGVRRETAGGYLKAAGIAIGRPGGWKRTPGAKPAMQVTTDSSAEIYSFSKPAMEVTTDFPRSAVPVEESRHASASACELYREMIELGLSQGRNAMGIWQDLVDVHGFRDSYQSVKRFVRKLRGMRSPEARVVIETSPGEEAQVDYGSGPMVRDPQSGKYRRTRMFVLMLGYSRKSVRLLCFRSSTRTWAELHEKAFRRLGGSTRVVVLDNLKEGVLVPDIYDPSVNPLYRDVLAHYGVVALPCRIRDPDRKGKVESGVGHAKKTPLKGKRFESLEEAQAYLDHWEEHWADTRIHGTTKRQVAAMFAEEKPLLQALPLEPFRYYQYGDRTVHLDGCVEVDAAYYGAPPGWIGRKVRVQWDGSVRAPARSCGPDNCCASTCDRSAAHIASAIKIVRGVPHCRFDNCWRGLTRPEPASALSVMPSTNKRPNLERATFRACSRSPRSMAARPQTRSAPWPWNCAYPNTAS